MFVYSPKLFKELSAKGTAKYLSGIECNKWGLLLSLYGFLVKYDLSFVFWANQTQ